MPHKVNTICALIGPRTGLDPFSSDIRALARDVLVISRTQLSLVRGVSRALCKPGTMTGAEGNMLRRLLDGLYLFAGYLAGGFLILIFAIMMVMSLGRQVALNIPAGDDFA